MRKIWRASREQMDLPWLGAAAVATHASPHRLGLELRAPLKIAPQTTTGTVTVTHVITQVTVNEIL